MEEMKWTLQAARVNKRLSRAKVCKILGIGSNTIYMWESGRSTPNAIQIGKLCELYGVKFEQLNFLPDSSV